MLLLVTMGLLAGAVVALCLVRGARRTRLAADATSYRLFFAENPLPMWVYDVDTFQFLAVNGAAVAHYGYSREEFLAMTIKDIRPPEDVPRLVDVQRRAPPRRNLSGRFRHVKKSGAILDVEIVSHAIEYEGRPARVVLANDVTERLRAEDALLDSEARFRGIFEQAAVGISLVGLNGRWRMANERLCAMLGYSREELFARTALDVTHPDTRDRDAALFARVLSGEVPSFVLEKRYLRKDGTPLWVSVSGSLARDERGAPLYVVGVTQDISARKAAEEEHRDRDEALRSKTARLAAIVEAQQEIAQATLDLETALPRILERAQLVTAADGAAVGHVDGDEVVYSVATGVVREHAGFRVRAEESLSGACLRSGEMLRCDDAASDPRTDQAVLARIGVRSVVALPLTYQGVALGVLLVGARRPMAFGDEELQALYIFGGMLAAAMSHAREFEARQRTIAERTTALEALRDREEQYRVVTDGVPILIAYVDAEERMCFVNRAYELAFERSREEIIGRPMREVLGEEAYDRRRPWLEAALAGERVNFDVEYRVPGGAVRHDAITYVPRFGDGGAVLGFFALIADMTERDQLEEQFRQAQKMEAIGKLAGGVAHDFNNILSVITSITSLLLESSALAEEQRADLAEIRRAAGRAADLTRKLLAFSRRQTLQPRVVDVNAVIADAEKMLRRLIREDVALTTELAPRAGRVFADPAQLEQVLVNLVVNARDALPGGGRIVVSTADVELDSDFARRHPGVFPGPHVRLSISDDGAGMPTEVLARAFEPFFTTKEQGKGTGLGLATVYGIVKQSGGSVSIASAPGQGTTVSVYLPRLAGAHEAPLRSAPRAAARGGSETVLLVEDEELVRVVARRVLEDRGYRVLCARHGHDALALAAHHRGAIHLLLTDVVMPEMGGRELAERLVAAQPGLPVLFTSGYAADELGDEGVLGREVAFVQKPFTPDGLARAVREALDGAPPPGGAPPLP